MYSKIGLAFAFSPTCKALLAETTHLKKLFKASLVVIHVGIKTPEKVTFLNDLLADAGINLKEVKVVWKQGKPASTIIQSCKKEKVDLLIAGALKHESLISYYLGSVARKILRKSACSVLILTEPSEKLRAFNEIVIDAEDNSFTTDVLTTGLNIARLLQTNILHLVREIKLYGLAMSIISENSISELSDLKKNLVAQELKKVEKELEKFDVKELRINIKIIAGKSGFELRKFAKHISADLLIVGADEKKMVFFDRLFKHDLEYIFEDIPCNLLLVKKPQY